MGDVRDQAVKRTNMSHYAPKDLHIKPGLNARDLTTEAYRERIAELAEDIAVNGVRTPMEVFGENGKVYVSHGHTRFAALQLLMEQGRAPVSVPCIPETRGRNDADRIVDQYRLNLGSPLSPPEIAYNISRLLKLGWDQAKIAERHGKSVSWVDQMLKFGEAAPETQQAVLDGKISATLATDIVRREGATRGAKVIAKAIAEAEADGKTRATARHVPKAEAENEPTVRQLRKLVDVMRVHIGRGGAGAANWAAKFLIEAGIDTD